MDCTSFDMTLTVTLSPACISGGVAGLGLPLYMTIVAVESDKNLLYAQSSSGNISRLYPSVQPPQLTATRTRDLPSLGPAGGAGGGGNCEAGLSGQEEEEEEEEEEEGVAGVVEVNRLHELFV
jgi:hypothetical protein